MEANSSTGSQPGAGNRDQFDHYATWPWREPAMWQRGMFRREVDLIDGSEGCSTGGRTPLVNEVNGVHLAQPYLNPRVQEAISKAWLACEDAEPQKVPERRSEPSRSLQRRLSEEEIRTMIAAYEAGALLNDLGERFGVARSTVSRQLNENGVKTRYAERKLSPQQVRQVASLYRGGRSLAAIGTRMGVSSGTIRRALVRNGVKLRPGSNS